MVYISKIILDKSSPKDINRINLKDKKIKLIISYFKKYKLEEKEKIIWSIEEMIFIAKKDLKTYKNHYINNTLNNYSTKNNYKFI